MGSLKRGRRHALLIVLFGILSTRTMASEEVMKPGDRVYHEFNQKVKGVVVNKGGDLKIRIDTVVDSNDRFKAGQIHDTTYFIKEEPEKWTNGEYVIKYDGTALEKEAAQGSTTLHRFSKGEKVNVLDVENMPTGIRGRLRKPKAGWISLENPLGQTCVCKPEEWKRLCEKEAHETALKMLEELETTATTSSRRQQEFEQAHKAAEKMLLSDEEEAIRQLYPPVPPPKSKPQPFRSPIKSPGPGPPINPPAKSTKHTDKDAQAPKSSTWKIVVGVVGGVVGLALIAIPIYIYWPRIAALFDQQEWADPEVALV